MSQSPPPRRPLAFYLGVVIIVLALIAVAYQQFLRQPDAEAVAAQVRPLIVQSWQTDPVMSLAAVERVTLVHKAGSEYTGFVEYAFGAYATRVGIDVAANGSQITWKVHAGEKGMPIRRQEFNGNPVFAEFPIADAEAKAFGEWMVKEKYFARDGASLLRRNGAAYVVHVCVLRGVEIGVVAEAAFTILAERLSAEVFHAAPVDVVICDPTFATLKVVGHR